MNRIARAALLLILGGVALGGRSEAGPLDPTQFASLGSLVLNPGSYTIDSSAGVLALNAGGSTFFGVISDGVAVFDFDSITIARGAVLTAAQGPGGLPIALLSRSFETINGTIDVSAFGNQAGPGASFFGVGGSGISGRDPAAGNTPGASGSGSSGAGGGGFGGAGGQGGQVNFTFPNRLEGGAGGDSYARLSSVLLGGSRGGTGFFGRNSLAGFGGGAIELGAARDLTVSGAILANGADALGGDGSGGGSGGGIFLHATSVTLSGRLNVQGGAGGFTSANDRSGDGGGGGGGGGQILVESAPGQFTQTGARIFLAGGQGGDGAGGFAGSAGQDGQFVALAVPEPSSLALLGISTLGLLGYAGLRRRAHPRPAA